MPVLFRILSRVAVSISVLLVAVGGSRAELEQPSADLWSATAGTTANGFVLTLAGSWESAAPLDNPNGASGVFGRVAPAAIVPPTTTPTETPTETPSETPSETMVVSTPTFTPSTPPTSTPTETPTRTMAVGTPTFTPSTPPTATETPTATTQVACDSGYYILDSLGGRHRVGNPIVISGPVYFGGDIARDLERAAPDGNEDLVLLDGLGAAHFVADPSNNIPQEFYFGDQIAMFPQGRAVDLQMTADSQGLWVLTDFGGVHRAGSAKDGPSAIVPGTDQSGVLGFDIPLTGLLRDPGLPDPGGASLRAVSFVAIDEDGNSKADGYVVLDSMGGQHRYAPNGDPIMAGVSTGLVGNEPLRLLDPDGYVWPFFPGLDIARDMELESSQSGVAIFDGWGGIHPVPVDVETNPVFFANNIVSATDTTPTQLVGMPYITAGFDDPDTVVNEGDGALVGYDAASVFADIEFSAGCGDSLYTLDRFGGVFVLGAARANDLDPVPAFGESPYFFPFLYAEDFELFAGNETGTTVFRR